MAPKAVLVDLGADAADESRRIALVEAFDVVERRGADARAVGGRLSAGGGRGQRTAASASATAATKGGLIIVR
jgi:hypothetical protein